MPDSMPAEETLRAASAYFYEAVNAVLRGDDAPMRVIWSHAADTTYCDPTGAIVGGWEALRAYWERAATLNRAAATRISASAELVALMVLGDLAYIIVREHVTVVQADGATTTMIARATNIYRRESGGWRLLHRHADAAPAR
jgi:ketosteroid isomerase-like protein